LPELKRVVHTVFCFGNDAPLRLIHRKLIVGETLGRVPDETPMCRSRRDAPARAEAVAHGGRGGQAQLDLDLRKPTDLDRSRCFTGSTCSASVGQAGRPARWWWGARGDVSRSLAAAVAAGVRGALIEAAVWGNTCVRRRRGIRAGPDRTRRRTCRI
jgi:hypothetical protein